MRLGKLSTTLILGLAVLSSSLPGHSQTSKGILSGVVRDKSGAVVTGAHVTITNLDTGETRAIDTGNNGSYRVDAVNPGKYQIHAESTGFQQFDVKGIVVSPSQVTSYDLELKPGQVNEIVQVEADQVLLNSENGSLAATVAGEALAKLPIFSLNPIELLTTQPGVQLVSNSSFTNGESIQVSGARPRSNNFMIDGQEINDATIAGQAVNVELPDMYSDVVAYTHDAPAEFGRASGGVVNMITKSGTNTFHGSVWELYSGSGLNSLDGQTRQATDKPRSIKARYNQHQYGFTLGGPIIKDKLFAFGAAQWSRYYGMEQANIVDLPNSSGVALLQSIAAGNNATTAANATLLLQYLSNASYLNNFTDFGPLAVRQLGAACPTAGCTLGINRYRRPNVSESNPDTQWTYKIDFTPRQQDNFSFRYLHDRQSLSPDYFTNGDALPGFETQQGGPSEIGQGSWTHIFTPSLLNEFRVAETRLSFVFAPTASTKANPLYTAYNLNNVFGSGTTNLGFNQNFPQGRGQDQYQLQDTLAWTKSKHTIRVGFDIGRRLEKDLVSQNANGALNFAAGGTGVSTLGNFLLNQLGPSGSATRTFGPTRMDPHSWRSGAFIQDDYKFSPDLTINLGFRYDYFTNPENSLQYPAIDPNNPYAAINTVYKVSADRNNVAPRIGFAYSPHSGQWFANGKTVFRGGFGIFYDSDFTNIALNEAQSAPNAVAGTLTQTTGNGLSNATSLVAQVPKTLNPRSSVTSVVKNLVSPYSAEWNFGIERELPAQIGLSIMYVGNRGIKLFANQQYNYFDFNTGARLNPSRGAVNARGNFADSVYHGLELGVKHNFSHGIGIYGSYVYSKTLDDGSEVFTPDTANTSYTANLAPGGRGQDWGNSVYDHRHYAAISYVWSPAGIHSSNRGLDIFLSGVSRNWTISGTSRFQSGSYSTVNFSGLDANGDGNTANDRPLLSSKSAAFTKVGIDGTYVGGDQGVYYDLAANNADGSLVVVDPGSQHWLVQYGPQFLHQEIGRNSYLNPGMLYNDVAVEKRLPTSWLHFDRGSFVLRAEAQNIANHNNVNYLDVNLLDVGTSSFLNTSNARETNSRNVRFWAKFVF